jgi:hypothetical protein
LLVTHCHLGLAKLYRRGGKHEQAREHLTTATTKYRAMRRTELKRYPSFRHQLAAGFFGPYVDGILQGAK